MPKKTPSPKPSPNKGIHRNDGSREPPRRVPPPPKPKKQFMTAAVSFGSGHLLYPNADIISLCTAMPAAKPASAAATMTSILLPLFIRCVFSETCFGKFALFGFTMFRTTFQARYYIVITKIIKLMDIKRWAPTKNPIRSRTRSL